MGTNYYWIHDNDNDEQRDNNDDDDDMCARDKEYDRLNADPEIHIGRRTYSIHQCAECNEVVNSNSKNDICLNCGSDNICSAAMFIFPPSTKDKHIAKLIQLKDSTEIVAKSEMNELLTGQVIYSIVFNCARLVSSTSDRFS